MNICGNIYGTVELSSSTILRDVHVTLAGLTDERGGSADDLARAQRRARSASSAPGVVGVPDAQVEPIGVGKDKPRAMGHAEAAWQQNRRADIVGPAS